MTDEQYRERTSLAIQKLYKELKHPPMRDDEIVLKAALVINRLKWMLVYGAKMSPIIVDKIIDEI